MILFYYKGRPRISSHKFWVFTIPMEVKDFSEIKSSSFEYVHSGYSLSPIYPKVVQDLCYERGTNLPLTYLVHTNLRLYGIRSDDSVSEVNADEDGFRKESR